MADRFCESCRRPIEFGQDDPTPVSSRDTIRIGEEGCEFKDGKYVFTIRRGRDTYVGRGDCPSCAEFNAVGDRWSALRDKCTEDKIVIKRSFKKDPT